MVNRVRITFTNKPLTAWGGLATIIGKFLEKINFRSWIESNIPITETSNNGRGIYEKVLSQMITVLSGGSRFSHLLWWSHGKEVFQKIFNIAWLPAAASTLTRFWNKISTQKLAEIMGTACRQFARQLVGWAAIIEDDLNFDSSVLTRYGHQQGAKKGYNPKKKGRPSHHPLLSFLSSGYVLNFWNRSGDTASAEGIIDFFKQTIASLGSQFKVRKILCDTGFYLIEFIEYLESWRYIYIIAAPLMEILQHQIRHLHNWQVIDKGIEIADFYFKHQDSKWTKERRYVVVRQHVPSRPAATGKQPRLFQDLEEWKSYRVSLLVTNNETSTAEQVWRDYRPRANDENAIKDLKEGYNLDTFNLTNFWATEAVLNMICLVFYNLIHFVNQTFINVVTPKEQLKTLRLKYFIVPGELGSAGGYSILRLGLSGKKLREKLQAMLTQIHLCSKTLNCNAVNGKICVT